MAYVKHLEAKLNQCIFYGKKLTKHWLVRDRIFDFTVAILPFELVKERSSRIVDLRESSLEEIFYLELTYSGKD